MGRATNKDCTSEVLKRCIELAYSDMMTAGRYYSASFLNNKDEICLATNRAIIESNFVFSRKIIEDISLLFCDNTIGNDNHYVTGFGLAQKLINMTFKYLYVFSDLIFIDKPIPNFSSCDCPLDSIIIKKAHINDCVWSKLTEQQYSVELSREALRFRVPDPMCGACCERICIQKVPASNRRSLP